MFCKYLNFKQKFTLFVDITTIFTGVDIPLNICIDIHKNISLNIQSHKINYRTGYCDLTYGEISLEAKISTKKRSVVKITDGLSKKEICFRSLVVFLLQIYKIDNICIHFFERKVRFSSHTIMDYYMARFQLVRVQ